MESNAKPSQGTANHMQIPSSFAELKKVTHEYYNLQKSLTQGSKCFSLQNVLLLYGSNVRNNNILMFKCMDLRSSMVLQCLSYNLLVNIVNKKTIKTGHKVINNIMYTGNKFFSCHNYIDSSK